MALQKASGFCHVMSNLSFAVAIFFGVTRALAAPPPPPPQTQVHHTIGKYLDSNGINQVECDFPFAPQDFQGEAGDTTPNGLFFGSDNLAAGYLARACTYLINSNIQPGQVPAPPAYQPALNHPPYTLCTFPTIPSVSVGPTSQSQCSWNYICGFCRDPRLDPITAMLWP